MPANQVWGSSRQPAPFPACGEQRHRRQVPGGSGELVDRDPSPLPALEQARRDPVAQAAPQRRAAEAGRQLVELLGTQRTVGQQITSECPPSGRPRSSSAGRRAPSAKPCRIATIHSSASSFNAGTPIWSCWLMARVYPDSKYVNRGAPGSRVGFGSGHESAPRCRRRRTHIRDGDRPCASSPCRASVVGSAD